MSIASEIQRLQQAKADLKSEMESHGIVLGDGTIDTYPPKITDVYNAGYSDGQAEGGGDNYYDEFWDSAQNKGERTNYFYGFAGSSWNDTTFKPKYNITLVTANNIFASSPITNLKGILEQLKITLDFSSCTSASYILQGSWITHMGVIDSRSLSNHNYTFYRAEKLKYVEKVILKEDGSQSFIVNYSFGQCGALEHMPFEGCIGQPNFDMHWSTKLDKESLTSIINCLSTTTSGLAVTLSKTAVNNAFEGGSTGAEWLTLIGTKSNWTINLS